MAVIDQLLLPPLLALLLCIHLGYAPARLALPDELRPYRASLTPLLGCALFLTVAAALTTSTALTPPWIAARLALVAAPVNAWLLWPRTKNQEPGTDERQMVLGRVPSGWFSVLRGEVVPVVICLLLAALVFVLAILPPLRWGTALPIGSNWDIAEFYVPLGRALQLASQRDLASLGRNPLIHIFTTPPVSGRIHAFSYLHAVASSAAGVEPLRSYIGMMALALALQPLAVYPLGRALGLRRAASLLGAALAALAWLPLWVAYNGFSNHLMSLPLLPAALAGTVVALRDGSRRALLTGALLLAGLATAYYPAITAYVTLMGPVGLYLLWSRRTTHDERPTTAVPKMEDGGWRIAVPYARARYLRSSILHPHRSLVVGRWSLVIRIAWLALLGFILSGAAQAYFFLRSGFLQEMLRAPSGFQVAEFVGLADALGLTATFNREALAGDGRLVAVAAALALLLGLAAVLGRRAPILAAMGLGAALYQGYTAAQAYYYGFYKGVTFEIPIYTLLIAAGAALAWERTSWSRWGDRATGRQGDAHSPRRLVAPSLRLALCAGLALLLGLNAWTIWGLQRRYTAAGPQLWRLAESDAADLRAYVPAGATVLVVAPRGNSAIFNSLLSYTLLGHELTGRFKTAYATLDEPPGDRPAALALIPEADDPANYGYQPEDVRWAGAGMRLYGRAPGVLYHRALGDGGRYPTIAAGASIVLRIGPDRIALPGESGPDAGPPARVRPSLAIASFEPTAIEIEASGGTRRYALPGGLVRLTGDAIDLPARVVVRNTGDRPAYLWWGELSSPAVPAGVAPREDAFVQVAPARAEVASIAADIQVYTARLPEGTQKLTAVVSVAHTPGSARDWKEIGQWVFFPSGDRRLRLAADPERLTATLFADGRPIDLVGAASPAGDGRYRATLLLANDARVIYATTLWTWQVEDGRSRHLAAESVTFDIVPLPHPATALEARSVDGAIRLRGYTMPQKKARPGTRVALSLIWQSLRKIDGDLHARAVLRDASGYALAEQTLPIGAKDHGTGAWQEGEIAEQPLALMLPDEVSLGSATISVELIGPDGRTLPFADGARLIEIAIVEIVQ